MSTADVFQATRAALPNQAGGGTINYNAMLPQFQQFAQGYQAPAGRNWFSHEISNIQNAFQAAHPEYSDTDVQALGGLWAPGAASNPAPANMFAEGQRSSGGGLFGGGGLSALLTIGGLAMGLPGILDFLGQGAGALGAGIDLFSDGPMLMNALGGGGEAALAGGMSYAPAAFESAFAPAGGASVIPQAAQTANFLGGVSPAQALSFFGTGAGAENGFDFAGAADSAVNPSGEGVTSAGGPLANGLTGQVANWLQMNPWIKNVLGASRGAFSNRDNPLLGALMGYAGSMMPGTGGPLSNALGLGSGLLSVGQGMDMNRRIKGAMSQLDQIGDPGASMRADAQARLSALSSNPTGALANLPGYKAGLDAITRQRAAMGQLGSGNLATALLDYGGNIYNQERAAALDQYSRAGDPTRLAQLRAQMALQGGAGNRDILNGLSTIGFGFGRMGL